MKRARRLDAPLLVYREPNSLGCLVLEDFALPEIAIFFGFFSSGTSRTRLI